MLLYLAARQSGEKHVLGRCAILAELYTTMVILFLFPLNILKYKFRLDKEMFSSLVALASSIDEQKH